MSKKLCKHDIVVRYDYDQREVIIWSFGRDRYFTPTDQSAKQAVRTVLNLKQQGKNPYKDLSKELAWDLKYIGFDGSVRTIESSFQMPLDAYFDYTWACNLYCPDCYNREMDRNQTMPLERVKETLAQLWENGIMRIHLAGGEPFWSQEGVINYVATADDYGLGCSINCNGTLLTFDLCQEVMKHQIKTLTFSLDGHTATMHDKFRGIGCFDKVIEAVKLAVRVKYAMSARTKIQLKALWSYDTPLEVFEGLVRLGTELNIDCVQFHNPERCEFHNDGYYGQRNYVEGYYKRILFIRALQNTSIGNLTIWNAWNPIPGCGKIGLPAGHGCVGGQELIAIQPNGNLYPCLMNRTNLGNLFTDWHGDFKNFWINSEPLRNFHQDVQKVHKNCLDCQIYSYCRGGCKVRSKVTYGSMVPPDPLCPKEYLKNHPSLQFNANEVKYLNHFRPLAMVHSL